MPRELTSDQSWPADGSAKFHRELANGLHAMAQPLTMLRAAMEVLTMPASAGVDRRRYLEISAGAVERTCDVFTNLQDLVAASIVEADHTPFDLWDVISPVIEDRRRLLQGSGVAIAAAKGEAWQPIWGDAGRTEQAVAVTLQMAGNLASKGDVIELSGSVENGFIELTLRNTRRHGKPVDSTARLCLALAEANIVSQHGRYEFAEDPFRVSLALPVQTSGRWTAARS
jgi:hypothetical protein